MRFLLIAVLLTSLVSGCQKSKGPAKIAAVPVKGTVTLDGKPLADADVVFIPTESPAAFVGRTGGDGVYVLQGAAGSESGLKGACKVTISRMAKPDGSSLAPDEAPANVGATEQLPPKYSQFDLTTLSATVAAEGGTFDFPLVTN